MRQKAIREKEEARVLTKKTGSETTKSKKERPKNNKTSCVKRNCVIITKKTTAEVKQADKKIPAPKS